MRTGYSDAEIRVFRKRGEWSAVRRGAYLDLETLGHLDAGQRHELMVRAAVADLTLPAVVSHCSAAVLLGLPLWSTDLGKVHLTRQPPARRGASTHVRMHESRMQADDIIVHRGLQVTSPARTIVDLARTLPFEQAVVAADAALRMGLPHDALADVAGRAFGRSGTRAMGRVLRFADGRSESVGESRSRVCMRTAGLPEPDLQFEVRDAGGVLIGRSDFAWLGGRLLGEFDGKVKYGRFLRPGETAGDAVFREKRREDALRATGAGFVRWVWADLDHPARFAAHIRAALDAVAAA